MLTLVKTGILFNSLAAQSIYLAYAQYKSVIYVDIALFAIVCGRAELGQILFKRFA